MSRKSALCKYSITVGGACPLWSTQQNLRVKKANLLLWATKYKILIMTARAGKSRTYGTKNVIFSCFLSIFGLLCLVFSFLFPLFCFFFFCFLCFVFSVLFPLFSFLNFAHSFYLCFLNIYVVGTLSFLISRVYKIVAPTI